MFLIVSRSLMSEVGIFHSELCWVTRPLRPRGWSLKTHLDQKSEGACVGFAWAHELAAVPIKISVNNETGREIYKEAQTIDEWPGEGYEGTSVLAGAKIVKQRGYMTEYRWCFSGHDVRLALAYHGPVVFGINWFEGMLATDPHGYIHPTGAVLGGHAIVGIAVHTASSKIVLQNSWGEDWGIGGRCYLSWPDLDKVLAQQGECCVPIARRSTDG